jgi:O-antigen ligase
MDKRSAGFTILALAVIAALCVLARVSVGTGTSPIMMLVGLMGLALLLVLIVKHPAAFIVPMLFTPRDKYVPLIHFASFGVDEYKALTVLAVIVGLAMAIRLLWTGHGNRLTEEARHDWRMGTLSFLLFASVVSLSFLYTSGPDYGSDKLWRFLVFGSMAFFAPFLLMRSEEDVRDFTFGAVLFGVGLAISSLRFSHHGRIGPGQNIVHIGVGQAVGLAILLLLFYRAANPRLRTIAMLVCIPILAMGLVSAEARGPLFALVIALAMYGAMPGWSAYLVRRKQLVLGVLLVVGLALAGLSVYWFRGVAQSRLQAKTSELQEIFTGSIQQNGSAVERLRYYQDAPREFLRHPFLGVGVGGWSVEHFHQDMRNYPHNLVLEVGLEEGILGLVALAIFLGTIFFTFKRNAELVGAYLPALFPGLVYLFMLTMFSGDIVGNRFLWFWCGLVVTACGAALTSQAEAEPEEVEGLATGSEPIEQL